MEYIHCGQVRHSYCECRMRYYGGAPSIVERIPNAHGHQAIVEHPFGVILRHGICSVLTREADTEGHDRGGLDLHKVGA